MLHLPDLDWQPVLLVKVTREPFTGTRCTGSSGDSIQVYTEAGEQLGKILVPEKVSNCTFGGVDKNRLFITASTALYAIFLNTRGVQNP